ncbi:MAG: hypothetical protein Fur005_21600 [Roseiflexaceae bacterium]
MDVRIDEKGKFFTPRVAKDAMQVLIRTADQHIIGYVYVRPDKRMKDEINEDSARFLSITDAQVFHSDSDSLIYRTSFLLVSFTHIVSITPTEAISASRPAPWMDPDVRDGEVAE